MANSAIKGGVTTVDVLIVQDTTNFSAITAIHHGHFTAPKHFLVDLNCVRYVITTISCMIITVVLSDYYGEADLDAEVVQISTISLLRDRQVPNRLTPISIINRSHNDINVIIFNLIVRINGNFNCIVFHRFSSAHN